ncbi:hypothetical protein B0A48_14201 [Cryoendolithus antarcticus]|uniref:Uncharacterized protein n=1 Tax=Cryoendolithus antarcticus TaxID=1507870 RepID=A0A1V8SLF4_9PEZI|nr:hypothetical protein B0A48_14201 [Cryoendolithus antarcticus]
MAFLGLPTELRLQIYDIALHQSSQITIGSAELTGSAPDIIHRLYGDGRKPFSGLQHNHEPVIVSGYDAGLLGISKPAHVSAEATQGTRRDYMYHDAHATLSRVNRQINTELKSHLATRAHGRNASLFVSYPSGLHILRSYAPGLLQQARSVHLAGAYTGSKVGYRAQHGAHLPNATLCQPGETKRRPQVIPDSTAQLKDLLTSCFGPKSIHKIQQLDMRIYYVGPDSYSMIWSPETSPVVVALTEIPNADFEITLYRGGKGTGVHLRIRPSEGRVVRTVWRPLQERPGGRDWVLDPTWPEWEDGEQAEVGMVVTG